MLHLMAMAFVKQPWIVTKFKALENGMKDGGISAHRRKSGNLGIEL
jgi:hypothetical protein